MRRLVTFRDMQLVIERLSHEISSSRAFTLHLTGGPEEAAPQNAVDGLKVRCPFHPDEGRHLGFDAQRGSYECESCGATGEFVTLAEHLTSVKEPVAALLALARSCGVTLSPEATAMAEEVIAESHRLRLSLVERADGRPPPEEERVRPPPSDAESEGGWTGHLPEGSGASPHNWALPAPEFVNLESQYPEFLIPGWVPTESFLILHAPPGAGKTWLALHWAAKLAADGQRVLVVEEEGPSSALQERLRLLNMVSPNVIIAHNRGVRLDESEWVDRIIRRCVEDRVTLLILDPLAELHGFDENSARDVGRLNQVIKRILRAVPGMSGILLHHTTKSSDEQPEARMTSLRGSSALSGAADVQIALKQVPGEGHAVNVRVTMVKARSIPKPPPARFRIRITPGETPAQVEWAEEAPQGEAGAGPSPEELDERALLFIPATSNCEVVTRAALRDALHVGKDKCTACIERLLAAGKVVEVRGKGLQRPTREPGEEG